MIIGSSRVLPEIRTAITIFMAKESALRMLQLVDSSNPKAHQKLINRLGDFSGFTSTVSQTYVGDDVLQALLRTLEGKGQREDQFFVISEDPALDGQVLTSRAIFAGLVGSFFGTFAVAASGSLALYKSERPGNILVLKSGP